MSDGVDLEEPAGVGAVDEPAGEPVLAGVCDAGAAFVAHVATFYEVGLAVGVVLDEVRGGEAGDDAPVAGAARGGDGASVEPADWGGAAFFELFLQGGGGGVLDEGGGEAQGAEGAELGRNVCAVAVLAADDVVGVVVADLAPVAGNHGAAGAEALAVAGAAFVVELVLVGDFEGAGASGFGFDRVLIHQFDQLFGVGGVGGVALLLQHPGGVFAGGDVVDAFVGFEVFVPVVDEVADAGLDVREVDEGVSDGDPLVVEEFLGFGGGAFAFEAEEVVAARGFGAVGGFQGPLGGDQFGEFGASDAGGFGDAAPVVGDGQDFAALAPGFEPGLVAAEDVGVGLVDGFLQFLQGGHLVREGTVKPAQIQQTEGGGVSHGARGRGWISGRRASGTLRSAARDLWGGQRSGAMRCWVAGFCARWLFPRRQCSGYDDPEHVRQSGSALFCLEEIKDLENKLDDAVALEGGQSDQLGGGGDHDPEGWMRQEVHEM